MVFDNKLGDILDTIFDMRKCGPFLQPYFSKIFVHNCYLDKPVFHNNLVCYKNIENVFIKHFLAYIVIRKKKRFYIGISIVSPFHFLFKNN